MVQSVFADLLRWKALCIALREKSLDESGNLEQNDKARYFIGGQTVQMGKVFLIASGKGGTGKTMFAVNFGAVLASGGKRVCLIDMDLGMRNMDLYLGMENRVVFNIMDVMSGICKLNKALMKVRGFDSLYFMAASPRKDGRRITAGHMTALCDVLKKYFDYIIIDCGAGMGEELQASAAAADQTIIVTEPEIAALRDADTLASWLLDQGMRDNCMVINKIDVDLIREGITPDIAYIVNNTVTPVAGFIQMDRDIRVSTSRGVPVVCKTGTETGDNLRNISRQIVDQEYRV